MQLLVSAVSSMQLARMRSAVAAMRHAIVVDSQQIDKQRKLAALGQESNYRIAELAAEMEEVQTDELKATMLDLEGRDAVIRNLEEAIRM